MIDENMSGRYIERSFAPCCGDGLVSRVMSEAGLADGDTDELHSVGEQSDDCISCNESVALSNRPMLDEAEKARFTERVVARLLVWWQQVEAKR